MMNHKFLFWLIGILCLGGTNARAADGGKNYFIIQPLSDSVGLQQRPNVIIVLTDDQGYGDLSCHGNPILQTPAIDKLYRESIRLDNFHVTPLCTPTRGQLMTGLDAMNNRAATVGRGLGLMRRDILTMPEVFKENGYETGIFGKWHLGDSYPDRPMDRGFGKAVWIKGWGIFSEIEYDNDYHQTRYLDGLATKYSKKYCTDLWFDQAMGWMEEVSDRKKPFFTYLSLNAPHGPFDAPKEGTGLYRGKVDDPQVASFYGMIRNIDDNMGRLDAWLERNDLRDNTLLIFMTDNGTAAGADVYNAGMRGGKGSNYEGGHRVPCFIRWPDGKLGKARTAHTATQVQDILPTIIDLLDLKLDGEYCFDGVSLKDILKNNNDVPADRMFVVQYGGLEELQVKYFSAVVWNSWRLVGSNELYDLRADPGQENDVAAAHPDVLNKMKAFYDAWWKKVLPGLDKYVPLVVGAEENPVTISADSWTGGSINTYWKVALGLGAPRGGVWPIHVAQSGKYRLRLSRWPFHLNRRLTAAGPLQSIGGKTLNPGKALPIEAGCVALSDHAPAVAPASQEATEVIIDMELPRGENRLRAWFRDSTAQDICGAYFVSVERIDDTEQEK